MSSEQQERQDLHDPILSKAPDNSAAIDPALESTNSSHAESAAEAVTKRAERDTRDFARPGNCFVSRNGGTTHHWAPGRD